jgi:hypothetical protein
MATFVSSALLGFLLGSSLLEARHQPVGSVDGHPSENTREKEKRLYTTSFTNTHMSLRQE